MTIDLPVTWVEPGPTRQGTATVTFDEVKIAAGYNVRNITRIQWPVGFPEDQKDLATKPLYHLLNKERQKVVPDDASVKP